MEANPPHFNPAVSSSRRAARAHAALARLLHHQDKQRARELAAALMDCADFYEELPDDTSEDTTRWRSLVCELRGAAFSVKELAHPHAPQPASADLAHTALVTSTALHRFATIAGVTEPNPENAMFDVVEPQLAIVITPTSAVISFGIEQLRSWNAEQISDPGSPDAIAQAVHLALSQGAEALHRPPQDPAPES